MNFVMSFLMVVCIIIGSFLAWVFYQPLKKLWLESKVYGIDHIPFGFYATVFGINILLIIVALYILYHIFTFGHPPR